jgi:hypothetical protein
MGLGLLSSVPTARTDYTRLPREISSAFYASNYAALSSQQRSSPLTRPQLPIELNFICVTRLIVMQSQASSNPNRQINHRVALRNRSFPFFLVIHEIVQRMLHEREHKNTHFFVYLV